MKFEHNITEKVSSYKKTAFCEIRTRRGLNIYILCTFLGHILLNLEYIFN